MYENRIIEITNSPSLIMRILQWLIRMVVNLKNVNESNCTRHRLRIDRLAGILQKLRGVKYEPVSSDGVNGEWMIPDKVTDDCTLYYLHGGGFVVCSFKTHRRMIAAIAKKADVKAFAIDYRKTPEHRFPSALEDAVKGYEYLLKSGIAPENIVIAGDSAGGGLAVATLVSLRDMGIPLPAAAVCISPWADLEGTGASLKKNAATEYLLDEDSVKIWGKIYAGKADVRHPLVSPIYADLSGLPPLFIQVSSSEILLDDSVRLFERALECGTKATLEKWNGLIHVWHFHQFMPEARKAIKNISYFINAHIG